MELIKLSLQEAALNGFTHKLTVTHEDLTEATADTDQTLQAFAVGAGTVVKDAAMFLKTPFEDASDTDLNDTTVCVGETDIDRFIAVTQVNENGTEIDAIGGVAAEMPYAFVGADTVDVTVASMTGKSLSNIDAGEVWFYFNIADISG